MHPDDRVWLEAVVKENDRKRSVARVISVEEKSLVAAGDNYFSQVTKIVVRAVRDDGEIVTKSFILKKLPLGAHTREHVLQGGYNFTEFTSYRDVLTSMELLLQEKEITDEPMWPKCITLRPYDKILFEDLTARGYKMADRLKGLDLEECTLVVQNLGLFHALSLVMKQRDMLANIVFGEHALARNPKDLQIWVETAFKKLLEDMKKWGDEWQLPMKMMKKKLPGYAKGILSFLRAPKSGFVVLNHGDTWTNNLLFKYNVYTGKPVLMKFLDFQIAFLSTPIYDLVYFLTTSPNMEVRRDHEKSLVRIYYNSLTFNMRRLGITETPPTLDNIENEMKRAIYFKFYLMTTSLAMMTRKPGDTYDVEEILAVDKEAKENGESPHVDWMEDSDDYLRTIHQLTIKQALDEGSL